MRKIVERPPVAAFGHTVLACQRPHEGAFGMQVAEGVSAKSIFQGIAEYLTKP